MALTSRRPLGAEQYKQRTQGLQPAAPVVQQQDWNSRIEDIYNRIANRGPFRYNQQEDPLYKQYQSMYERNAKLAMQDTVGQVSALTGGFANSYAQTAGQAVYNQQMGQMNEKALELRNAALQEYQMEGDRLMQEYSLDSDMYDRAYRESRDTVADEQWAQEFAERRREFDENLALDKAQAARSSGSSSLYSSILDGSRNAARKASSGSDALTPSEQLARDKFEYQKERDAISDEQYADNLAYKYAALYAKGSGSTGSSKSSSGTKKSSAKKDSNVKQGDSAGAGDAKKKVDVADVEARIPSSYDYRHAGEHFEKPYKQYVQDVLLDAYDNDEINQDQYNQLRAKYQV